MSTASQRFLRISCDPAVYYNVNKRPPHWNSEAFWNVSYLHDFCSEKWLAPHTTLKLEGTPCRLYASLYSIYSQLPFHIRRPFLHSQSENASCCGDGDPLIIGFQPYHHQIIFLFRRTENYTSLLYFPIILPYYTSILYFPIILPYYTSLLYFPIILPYYTSLLYFPIILPYYTSLLYFPIIHQATDFPPQNWYQCSYVKVTVLPEIRNVCTW